MNRKIPNEEMNRLSIEAFKEASKLPLVVLLDNVRSAVNVGSVFRTGDAFRIQKVLLSGITPSPDRKMRKTALGATESVNWDRVEDPLEALRSYREQGYRCWGIEQTKEATPLRDGLELEQANGHLLVLGHEVDGVQERVLEGTDHCLYIEQFGTKHSLNISVCTGILLWEFQKRSR
ncbi:MAG: TrmH family RNA methyltransferase [Flavobacteriales bacterium]